MRCERCGAELPAGMRYCTSCGARLATVTADEYGTSTLTGSGVSIAIATASIAAVIVGGMIVVVTALVR